jgi:hypothetical protein
MLLVFAIVATACAPSTGSPPASPPPITPAPSPVAQVPSRAPSPSASAVAGRPSPEPDAPPIADPYWLSGGAAETGTYKDADGNVIRQDTGKSYQIYDGGHVEGDILINGEWVGTVGWTITEGSDGTGGDADPMLQQIKHFKGDTERTDVDGTEVYFLRMSDPAYAAAYWWSRGHDRWFSLIAFEDDDLVPITTALIGG